MSDTPKQNLTTPAQWTEEMLDGLNAFPHGLKFVLDGWEKEGTAVRGTNILASLADYPALAKAFLTFNCHVATASTLSAREREILILRLSWLRKCEYEHVMHIILGKRAGLSEEEVEATQTGPDANAWNSQDADLVRAVDELSNQARISDATFNQLSKHYSQQQVMDMIFLVGCYETMAMQIRSFNVPVESSEPGLDPDIKAKMMSQ
ncbi:carboxymuconolactone decarboxylase family protein [Pseudomaricurvus sp.]|uniref:carboxymuconolactone decarboxylase family protein n=1 Tax=Pseudomaricurvus sp. TaxID=2004510 RepID=UPI003F6BFCAC